MFRKPNSGKKSGNLSQFGLLDMDVDDADEALDLSDDDIDLEAELAAITGDGGRRHRPRKPMPVPAANLDALIAQSLQDVPSDDEGSGDDDDPDLLNELKELAIDDDEAPPAPPPRATRPAPAIPGSLSPESSTVSLLQDRILNYTAAEKVAKENGESSRARRFNRGLKTLNDLLKQAKAGRSVSDSDIPPPVSLGKSAADPAPVAQPEVVQPEIVQPEVIEPEPPIAPEPVEPPPPPPVEQLSEERSQGLQIILKRQQEFKAAALSYKQKGDKTTALEFLKVVKQFDMVVDAYKSGQEMDLSELPTVEMIAASIKPEKVEEHTQKDAEPAPAPTESGPIMAATLEEALQQRMDEYKRQEAKAKEEGNMSKARRLGRVSGQYAAALAAHAQGKPMPDLASLPVPLGYGPLPGAAKPTPTPTPTSPASPLSPAAPSTPHPPSRHDKQLAFLLHRQKEFKDAAIKAKKAGNIEQAKEYLRAAKGFDSVLDAARGGLKVDSASLPPPPAPKVKLEHTFDVVTAEDCSEAADESAISRLQHQLASQLKLCIAHRDHYQAMGQIAEVNRFDHLAVKLQQDLDVVVVAKGLGKTPKFHYESRQFSIVQCNTDLNENDLELTIVRGISYNVPNPKEVDTYVKFEYPYPQETPVIDRTHLVKDTSSPIYNAVFPLTIQRGARTTLRLFKRHGIKMEVFSRGGWFSSDKLLGTLTVKLAPLETHVTLHETFPLMDGRRPAGGSLEVKVRVRTPILTQQLENTTHRWVVIDD